MFRPSVICGCLLLIVTAAADPAVPPSPPEDLRFDEGTDSVTFVWSPPVLDGGSPVNGYTVHRILNGDLLPPVNVSPTSYTQAGLKSDDAIIVVVNAFNSAGSGPVSDPAIRGPIPRCDPFGISIDPLKYRLRPECLLP